MVTMECAHFKDLNIVDYFINKYKSINVYLDFQRYDFDKIFYNFNT